MNTNAAQQKLPSLLLDYEARCNLGLGQSRRLSTAYTPYLSHTPCLSCYDGLGPWREGPDLGQLGNELRRGGNVDNGLVLGRLRKMSFKLKMRRRALTQAGERREDHVLRLKAGGLRKAARFTFVLFFLAAQVRKET